MCWRQTWAHRCNSRHRSIPIILAKNQITEALLHPKTDALFSQLWFCHFEPRTLPELNLTPGFKKSKEETAVGFEPTIPGLQPGALDHLAMPSKKSRSPRDRTGNLLLMRQTL